MADLPSVCKGNQKSLCRDAIKFDNILMFDQTNSTLMEQTGYYNINHLDRADGSDRVLDMVEIYIFFILSSIEPRAYAQCL